MATDGNDGASVPNARHSSPDHLSPEGGRGRQERSSRRNVLAKGTVAAGGATFGAYVAPLVTPLAVPQALAASPHGGTHSGSH